VGCFSRDKNERTADRNVYCLPRDSPRVADQRRIDDRELRKTAVRPGITGGVMRCAVYRKDVDLRSPMNT
jgi:hypothetical protein